MQIWHKFTLKLIRFAVGNIGGGRVKHTQCEAHKIRPDGGRLGVGGGRRDEGSDKGDGIQGK